MKQPNLDKIGAKSSKVKAIAFLIIIFRPFKHLCMLLFHRKINLILNKIVYLKG